MPADSPVTFHRRVVLGLSAAYATALVGLLSSAVPPRTVEDDTVFEFSHIISDLFGYPTNSRLSCGDSSSYDDARVAQFCGLAAFAVLAVSEALGSVFWGNNQSSAPSNGLSQLTLPSAIFGTVSYAALAANSSPLGAGDASSFRADLARLLYLCFSTALHTYSLWTVGETSLAFLLRGLGFNAMMFLAGLTASMSSGVLMYASLAAFCCCFVGIGHHTWNLFGGGIREPHANNEAILEMKLLLFAVWVALLGGFVHQLLGKSHIYAEAAIVAAEVMNATIVISAYRHGVICMASDREHVLSQEKAVQMVAELKTRVARQERNFAELTQELRSPLHGMMGMIEVLLMKHSKEMSAQCISAVQAVRDAGARYQHLITNILDSCSVESISRNDLAYERVDFVSLLASVCQLLEPLLHSNTKLRSVVQDDLVIVEADSTCLMRIMFNLLGNAAKFTEAGKIAVYVSTASNSLHIQVKDSGENIPRSASSRMHITKSATAIEACMPSASNLMRRDRHCMYRPPGGNPGGPRVVWHGVLYAQDVRGLGAGADCGSEVDTCTRWASHCAERAGPGYHIHCPDAPQGPPCLTSRPGGFEAFWFPSIGPAN